MSILHKNVDQKEAQRAVIFITFEEITTKIHTVQFENLYSSLKDLFVC